MHGTERSVKGSLDVNPNFMQTSLHGKLERDPREAPGGPVGIFARLLGWELEDLEGG
jgi:hypothetical protein